MIWLEIISIRAAGSVEAEKALEIGRQMYLSIAGEKLLNMTVFRNAKYETDIGILLHWESDPGSGSVIGRAIIEALADLGLISHTVWVPAILSIVKTAVSVADEAAVRGQH